MSLGAQSGTAGHLRDRAVSENVKLREQALEKRPSLVRSMYKDMTMRCAHLDVRHLAPKAAVLDAVL